MTRRNLLWAAMLALPLTVAGGLLVAAQPKASGYICPLTGELLPCPRCCPLNNAKSELKEKSDLKPEEAYICPLTGDELPCPNCCPLNKQ